MTVFVAPTENVSFWVVIPIAIICVPLLLYLQLRLRRAKQNQDR